MVLEERPASDGYALGIDLGTTYSAAAILRGTRVEPVVLGTIAAQIPSVVVHRDSSEVLTGEPAERRAASEPTRAAREFKRRLGDPIPIIIGGVPYGAEALMSELLSAIVQQVTEREGEAPTTIVLTHPANYSGYKCGLLHEAARLAGLQLDQVRLITEPEAAAIAYAHQQRIEPGEVIAVYDLGGGTFDAAVVRDGVDGFELLGTPEGMERLGGIDFDQAVLFHVDSALGGLVADADSSDPQVMTGQARLRDECRRAKETLSTDTDATIAVTLPGVHTEVRLTRDELEQMVRPRIAETVQALQRTIESAGMTSRDVSRVLLVGGSSRMPIVGQIVREAIGRPVSVDSDPKLAIAIGAALSALPRASVVATPPAAVPARSAAIAAPMDVVPPVSNPLAPHSSHASTRRLAAVVGACAVLAAVAFVVVRNGDDSVATQPTTTSAGGTPVSALPAPSDSTATTPETVVPGSQPAPQLLAFDGTDEGVGIPGPALTAGAPGLLRGVAVGANGDVFLLSVGVPVLRLSGGQVESVAGFEAKDAGATGIVVASDGTVLISTSEGIVSVRRGVRELIVDGAAAGLSSVLGPLAFDGGGNLYFVDNGTARVLRRAPDGALTLVAGTGRVAVDGAIPAEGTPATTTEIGFLGGLIVDQRGNLLMADETLGRVRAVSPSGVVTTLAGGGTVNVSDLNRSTNAAPVDATTLHFTSLTGLAGNQQGDAFVGDSELGAIVRLDGQGGAQLVAGTGDTATIPAIVGLAVSGADMMIITDGLVVLELNSTN